MAIRGSILILDLYCGAGGASEGYRMAANELGIPVVITGVDISNQPSYPFSFFRGDALSYLQKSGKFYDFIHASPPCQLHSQTTAKWKQAGRKYADLLTPTLLKQISLYETVTNYFQRADTWCRVLLAEFLRFKPHRCAGRR